MKKIITSSLLLAAAVSAQAAPLVTVGDQLDLFFKGAVIGKWDSNITYTQNYNDQKKDDYLTVIRLGAEADYGRSSKFKANVKFYEDLTRYATHTQFNSNLSHVKATARYNDVNFRVNVHFSLDEKFNNSSTTVSLAGGDLVRFNEWSAGIDGSYDFTEKLFGEAGFDWRKTEYLHKWARTFSSYDMYTVPLSIFYRLTEKVSLGLTYQYRNTEFYGGRYYATQNELLGSARDDHFGGLTLRGALLPKLSVSAFAGATYRVADGSVKDETTFALNATVTYELTEKIGLFVAGRRDFGNGASRQSSIDTSGEIGINYLMNKFVSLTTSFSYVNSDYTTSTREDDEYIARAGITYRPNKYLTFGANYRYLDNSSNSPTACYLQHLVDISVAVKY